MGKFRLKHQFVEYIPKPLEEGVLYISIRFGIVAHNCCCGCGNEVVINLSPDDGWSLTYDGKTISLSPSIGNYNLKCQSHYYITNSFVEWMPKWDYKPKQNKHKKLFFQFWRK
jgi:hypothetical protein